MFNFGSSSESHYIRTTSQLRAEVPLVFPDSSQLRFFSEIEAAKLADTLRRRNVFARHSGENDFYVRQVAQLSNRTIIELYRFGEPDETYQQASEVAELIEQLVVLSSVLVIKKDAFLRQLGINSNVRPEIDLIAASDMKFIRSRSQRRSKREGILVNKQFHSGLLRAGSLSCTSTAKPSPTWLGGFKLQRTGFWNRVASQDLVPPSLRLQSL